MRGIRTNTLKASTDKIKVIESIDDQVGSYYFSPTLIASSSRRKQRPLYSAHPMGQTGSPFFDRAGSDRYSKDWSRSSMRAPQYKPINSTRVDTGQSSFRGRVRCQSHLVAWERRRREPGSNSVIVTIAFTRDEGHVLRLGGVRRVRKIFAGCPAIRPIWDQSPERLSLRFETVGNRLYPSHRSKQPLPLRGRGENPRPFTRKDRTKYRPGLFTRLQQHPLSFDGRGLG